MSNTAVRFGTGFFIVLSAAGLIYALYLTVMQAYAFSFYEPVKAEVLHCEIITRETFDTRGVTNLIYSPSLRYKYKVGGKEYTSSRAAMTKKVWEGETELRRLLRPYIPGREVQAYYNPSKPSEAYLIREFYFEDYGIAMGCIAALAVLTALFLWYEDDYRQVPAVKKAKDGTFLLTTRMDFRKGLRYASIYVLFYYGLGLLLAGHYFLVIEERPSKLAIVVASVFVILGIPILLKFAEYVSKILAASEVKLYVDRGTFTRGDNICTTMVQEIRRGLRILESTVSLVYAQHTQKKNDDSVKVIRTPQSNLLIAEDHLVAPGEALTSESVHHIPEGRAATGFSKNGGFPFFEWYFEIATKFSNGFFNYTIRFPIHVE
jgi:hypothetical protein